MSKIARVTLAIGLVGTMSLVVGIGVPCIATSQDRGPDKKPPTVQEARPTKEQSIFMRRKLDASNQILEGLLIEDSGLVVKGAKGLLEMSNAEAWQVRNDVMYKQFSTEFQQSAKKLVEAAEKENFDGAALRWIDTTLKCIECHKFVRGARIAGGK